jgi:hypothetical protein
MPRGRPKKKLVFIEEKKPVVTSPDSDSTAGADTEIKQETSLSTGWTSADPVITNKSVWVAVFKCNVGHKTKSTSEYRQVACHLCGSKAEIMSQFLTDPR